MCCWIEVYSLTAVDTFFYLAFKCGNSNVVVLKHAKAGTNHFAGVIVPALCYLILNEVLEVRPKCY